MVVGLSAHHNLEVKMRRVIVAMCTALYVMAIATNTNTNVSQQDAVEQVSESVIEESELRELEPIEEQEPVWWTEYDLDLLAAVIFYEAGSDNCTDEHQQLVGQVVINRMNDTRYPDTVYDVITDRKFGVQYSTANKVVSNAGSDVIPQRCYDNALVVLNGEIECPRDIIYQANFKQGTGIYKTFKTSYSTTYFCHG